MSELLDVKGYSVVQAENGQKALDILTKTPNLPCLVGLYLAMPVMGYGFLRLLAQDPTIRDIPVVIVSGNPPVASTNVYPPEARRAPARFSTERIEHDSAVLQANLRFSGHLNRTNFANVRRIFEYSAENAKIVDCLADGAVSREPVSASNSLINRERTGNFFDFSLDLTAGGLKKPIHA